MRQSLGCFADRDSASVSYDMLSNLFFCLAECRENVFRCSASDTANSQQLSLLAGLSSNRVCATPLHKPTLTDSEEAQGLSACAC